MKKILFNLLFYFFIFLLMNIMNGKSLQKQNKIKSLLHGY